MLPAPPPAPKTIPRLWSGVALALLLAALFVGFWAWRQANRPGVVHAQQGAADAAAGQLPQAEQEWLAGVRDDPQSPDCYVRLGDLYLQQKRFADAVRDYVTAARLSPQDGTIFFRLRFADLAVGDTAGARAAAKRAADLLPNDADAVGQYGLLESKSDSPAAALPALRRAHALRPDDSDFFYALIKQEMLADDFPSAVALLGPWLQAHPKDGWACHLMGVVYEKKPPTPDVLSAALGYEERARAELPDDLRVYVSLGSLYLASHRTSDALRAYQAGQRLKPDSGLMLNGLVTCYSLLGKPQLAAAAAARLQATTALDNRIAHLHDALRLNPKDVTDGLELARLEEQDSNAKGAQGYYFQLIRAVPTDPRVRPALAAFYRRQGQPDMARQALRPDYVP